MSSRDIDESSENVLSEWPNQAEPEVDADEDELGTTDDDGAPAWGTASAFGSSPDAARLRRQSASTSRSDRA